MDAGKRRSRRRSALKLLDIAEDGDTAVLGRKKRVSFSTDIAEVRKFREQLSTSNEDMAVEDEMTSRKSITKPLRAISTNQGSNETVYVPPEGDLTVNFDPANQDTFMFADQLKSSSTPQDQARKTKKSSLAAIENPQEIVGWRNSDGHVYSNLQVAITLGERKRNLTEVTLSEMERTNHSCIDMDVTNVRQQEDADMDETNIQETTNYMQLESVIPANAANSGLMEMTCRKTSKQGSTSRSMQRSKDVNTKPITEGEKLGVSATDLTNEWTAELGRRDVTQRSMLPPPVGDVTLIRPKATAERLGAQKNTSNVKVEPRESIKFVVAESEENGSDDSENVLSMQEFLSLTGSDMADEEPLAPVLTAKSTAGCMQSDGSVISPPQQQQSRNQPAAWDVMAEASLDLDASSQLSPSTQITSNMPQEVEKANETEQEVSPKEIELADVMIADLMKELEDARAIISIQDRIEETKAKIELEKEKSLAAQKKFDKAEKRYNTVYNDNYRSNTELRNVFDMIGLLDRLSLWSYEPHPDKIGITTFKFPVGVEFDIAQLRVTVTVDSLNSMLIEELSADLCEVLTGDLMPSYRLELLKSLLQLSCTECDSLLRTEGLPLLLHRLSSLVVRTNQLLEEIEHCFIQLGWFEFFSDKILYRVANRCDWACYYIINGLDLESYPSDRLTFSYEPHLGTVPDRMSDLCDSLNEMSVGDHYLTRCTSLIRQTIG